MCGGGLTEGAGPALGPASPLEVSARRKVLQAGRHSDGLEGLELVLLRVLEVDGLPRGVEGFDVQAQGAHLLDEDLEGFGDARLGDVVPLTMAS